MDDLVNYHFDRFDSRDEANYFTRSISYTQNGVPYGGYTVPNSYTTRNRTFFFGVKTPGYNYLKKSGALLPLTAFRKFKAQSVGEGMMDMAYEQNGVVYRAYCTTLYPGIINPFIDDVDVTEAIRPYRDDIYLNNAVAKLGDGTHDTLTFLAEFTSVKRMFANLAKKIHYFLLGVPDDAIKASSAWLTWRYGYRPLIKDLNDLNEAISNISFKLKRLKSRAGGSFHTTQTKTYGPYVEAYGTHLVTQNDYVDVSIRGNCVCDIWLSPFQLNPYVTAWETIPFSFVIDWALGVGKWISAMSNLTFSTRHVLSTGAKVSYTRSIRQSIVYRPPNASGDCYFDGECYAEFVIRKPASTISSYPLPNLRIDGFKIADLIALLVGCKLNLQLRGN